jgi:hypothetical protein
MANIDEKKLREKLYTVASALFRISEVCVDVSKKHISADDAIDKIRGYLGKAEMFSKYRVDKLIADCAVNEYIFTANKDTLKKIPKTGTTRLVEAKERTQKYEKRV